MSIIKRLNYKLLSSNYSAVFKYSKAALYQSRSYYVDGSPIIGKKLDRENPDFKVSNYHVYNVGFILSMYNQ